MSIYKYLQLQPIQADDGDDVADLNRFEPDETFDLSRDEDPDQIVAQLDKELAEFKKEPLNFSDANK